jgi:hypothetical protein
MTPQEWESMRALVAAFCDCIADGPPQPAPTPKDDKAAEESTEE